MANDVVDGWTQQRLLAAVAWEKEPSASKGCLGCGLVVAALFAVLALTLASDAGAAAMAGGIAVFVAVMGVIAATKYRRHPTNRYDYRVANEWRTRAGDRTWCVAIEGGPFLQSNGSGASNTISQAIDVNQGLGAFGIGGFDPISLALTGGFLAFKGAMWLAESDARAAENAERLRVLQSATREWARDSAGVLHSLRVEYGDRVLKRKRPDVSADLLAVTTLAHRIVLGRLQPLDAPAADAWEARWNERVAYETEQQRLEASQAAAKSPRRHLALIAAGVLGACVVVAVGWMLLDRQKSTTPPSAALESIAASADASPTSAASLNVSDCKVGVARSNSTDPAALALLAACPAVAVRIAVAENGSTPAEALFNLAGDGSVRVRWRVARHPAAPQEALKLLSVDKDALVRKAVASNAHTSPSILWALVGDHSTSVRVAAIVGADRMASSGSTQDRGPARRVVIHYCQSKAAHLASDRPVPQRICP